MLMGIVILFSFALKVNGQIISSLLKGDPSDSLITNYNNLYGGLTDMTADMQGNIYVLNNGNHRILKITKNGVTTIVAGCDDVEFTGDGRLATSTHIDAYLKNIVVDTKGNIYFSTIKLDSMNVPNTKEKSIISIQKIRKINEHGILSTIPISSKIKDIICFAVDDGNNLYVAENAFIKKIDSNGKITTIVDSSAFKKFLNGNHSLYYSFNCIKLDNQHNLYVGGNNWILQIDKNGVVSKIAGNGKSIMKMIPVRDLEGKVVTYIKMDNENTIALDGKLATSGSITTNNLGPESFINICLDKLGNLYFSSESTGWSSDSLNNIIRKVNSRGIISTIVGNGREGYSDWDIDNVNLKITRKGKSLLLTKNLNGDGGIATLAQLSRPSKIAIDGQGNLIILDNSPSHIKIVTNVGLNK